MEQPRRSYFPVLRGKQYELLALREMANVIAEKKKIVPVVEPLTIQATTSALDKFTEESMPFCLIVNPTQGALSSLSLPQVHQQLLLPYVDNDLLLPTLYVDGNSTSADIAQFVDMYPGGYAFFIVSDPKAAVVHTLVSAGPTYVMILNGTTSGPTRAAFDPSTVVDITEPFRRQPRNKDYPNEEFFSDIHLRTPGHFGDYSIIGRPLSEGGPAYCVAIHMVYALADADHTLWIKHYKSDSNDTPTDPGGKFLEAVQKLADEWPSLGIINQTSQSNAFDQYSANQTYPGLGKVKQRSIMHHLELMQDRLL